MTVEDSPGEEDLDFQAQKLAGQERKERMVCPELHDHRLDHAGIARQEKLEESGYEH